MFSVFNILSEYAYFYISKNITLYIFPIVFEIIESLQCIIKSGHSKKNSKNNIRFYHWNGNHDTALYYQEQNINSYNDGVQRNPTQLPQRDNKVSKTNEQNKNQYEDWVWRESQEKGHESNMDEKLSCLLESNMSIILQAANAIATDNYENKISTGKILLDSWSRQTFISEELPKESNSWPFREVLVDINTFMSNHKHTTMSLNKKLLLKVLEHR